MIYLKLILALVLSALPFFYVSYIRPKEKTSPVWRNMFTAIGTQLPHLTKVKNAIGKFLHRLYDGMKKSDNFRKFFSLIILLLMIAVQFVDFSASTSIARMTQESTLISQQTAKIIAIYGPMMTRPHATVLAACLSLTFFSYSVADWFLTRLHNKQRFFFGVALITLIILFATPRYFIVAEILEMILLAALIYPNKISEQRPKGRKTIPKEDETMNIKKAA